MAAPDASASMRITSIVTVEQTITSYPPGYSDALTDDASSSALPDGSQSKPSTSAPILAGAAGGGAALLLVFVLTLYCCIRKRKKRMERPASENEKQGLRYRDAVSPESLDSYTIPKPYDSPQISSRPWLSRSRSSISSYGTDAINPSPSQVARDSLNSRISHGAVTSSVLISGYMDDHQRASEISQYLPNVESDHPYNRFNLNPSSENARSSTAGILHYSRSSAGVNSFQDNPISTHTSRNYSSVRFSDASSLPVTSRAEATTSMASGSSFPFPIQPSPTGEYAPDSPESFAGTMPLLTSGSTGRVRALPAALLSGVSTASSEQLRTMRLTPAPPPRFSGLSRVAPPSRNSTLTERLRRPCQNLPAHNSFELLHLRICKKLIVTLARKRLTKAAAASKLDSLIAQSTRLNSKEGKALLKKLKTLGLNTVQAEKFVPVDTPFLPSSRWIRFKKGHIEPAVASAETSQITDSYHSSTFTLRPPSTRYLGLLENFKRSRRYKNIIGVLNGGLYPGIPRRRFVYPKRFISWPLFRVFGTLSGIKFRRAPIQRLRRCIGVSSIDPMVWTVKILARPSTDTQLMVSVSFPSGSYLFGTGESAGRVLSSTHSKLSRFKAIFTHGVESEQAGGLGGLLLGLGASAEKISLGGPKTLEYLVASMRSYVRRDQVGINMLSFNNGSDPLYVDDNVTVQTVRSFPSISEFDTSGVNDTYCPVSSRPQSRRSSASSSSSDGINTSSASSGLDEKGIALLRKKIISEMFPHKADWKYDPDTQYSQNNVANLHSSLPLYPACRAHEAVSYIITGPIVRGKFDVKKADLLDVPVKSRGILSSGKSIFVGDKEIKPEDVLGASRDSESVAIIYCPTMWHLNDLVNDAVWLGFESNDRRLRVMMHSVPMEIYNSEIYKNFKERFTESEHVLFNREICADRFAFEKSAAQSLMLKKIAGENDIFNFPVQSLDVSKGLGQAMEDPASLSKVVSIPSPLSNGSTTVDINCEWIFGKSSLPQRSHPEQGLNPILNFIEANSSRAELCCQQIGGPAWSEALEVAEWTHSHITKIDEVPHITCIADDIIITALGTGSASPSDYRNVACTIIHLPNDRGCIMVDCGESSWAQMRRRWGFAEALEVLRNLKLIFISHMHADHHMGLVSILSARRTLLPLIENPVYVLGPVAMIRHLEERSRIEDIDLYRDNGVQVLYNTVVDYVNPLLHNSAPKHIANICNSLGLNAIKTCVVDHRARCFGLIIESHDGWKVVYSGDTRPCDNLIQAGRGADVLVHEATMEDDLVEMAFEKGHSTVQQALDTAAKMGAKHVFLTHISQRYPKIQVSKAEIYDPTQEQKRPISAFLWDFMSIKVKDAWKVGYLMKPIKYLYATTSEGETNSFATQQLPPDSPQLSMPIKRLSPSEEQPTNKHKRKN